ncbi:amino acid adenylation domain-containing protein [Lentzea waywayandensis]|uniref:Amino acid adenylation domain-containing protein n=1 Tax=Lentzea waywayandensis TaxID=84724 RepID=A0A1I6FDJ6_9PSEU|nr:non-ribosomal peptide synthetase [Lentzea waywayandensis]SFR28059.1 amino acid adenylation domain-containing protein [Lentzea waywayandensis]
MSQEPDHGVLPRLDEYFLEQVRLRPDAVAVVGDGTVLSYRELARRAVAVAGGLARLGVRRETLVGMSFDRGVDAVVATVGIMLAGGAYVPVNPAFPRRRITELITSSGTGLVVCAADAVAPVTAAAPDGVEVLELAQVSAWGRDTDLDTFAVPAPLPEHRSPLAHVLFTSGSTGEPKGVMVEHAGICRMAREPDHLRFSPSDHVLHAHPLEFDAATLEIWSALLNGARLCVVETTTMVVPDRLAACLREYGITFAWVTAPLFNQLVDEDPAIFAPLTKVFTGGDVVSARHIEAVRAQCPHLAVHNGYGPTENTVFTTLFRIDEPVQGPVPIGRPIRDTTVLVLDENRRPVPAGVVGELYTGGLGVARGYLNNPELTRERFVDIGGEPHYRTGDFVHQDADGLLHFHGRADGQVKVRGHRVETAEVTAALLAVPGVLDAHVRVAGDAVQDKRLVGYLVAPEIGETEVRAALADVLPGYLLPDQFVWLDRLPLNANGKVDGPALPAAGARPARRHTAEQHGLAELWSEVLDLAADTIGQDDAFLEIGGNSIKLGALLGRIDRRLGVRLPFGDALQARTLAGMTAALASAAPGRIGPIPRRSPATPVDLHPRQVGLYLRWQADPQSLVYNVPVRLRISGAVEPQRMRAALGRLLDRHDALRMRFVPGASGVRQIPDDGLAPEFDHLDAPEEDVLARFVRPFRADHPPLLRALLVRTGRETAELYLDAHHIVLDGVSLRVLVDELLDLYAGIEPAQPATTYAAAAQWCHDRPVDPADEAYWLSELDGAPSGLALPADHPRGARRAVRGGLVRRELDTATLVRLEQAARRAGTTAFTITLAAYAATLARVSGQRDIVIGTPASGRGAHPELESVVGMFVNMLCLRARMAGRSSLGGLARRLDEGRRDALTHQDCPFEHLVKRLGVVLDPARNPLFDAVFAYQDIDFYEFDKHGLRVSAELVNPGTTRFDLNLQLYRRPDRIVLELEYAAELFRRDTAENVVSEYLATLSELIENPATPVFSEPFRRSPSR